MHLSVREDKMPLIVAPDNLFGGYPNTINIPSCSWKFHQFFFISFPYFTSLSISFSSPDPDHTILACQKGAMWKLLPNFMIANN